MRATPTASPLVLVIEPHQATRLLWTTVLRSIGCRPIAVKNGGAAARLVARVVPRLLITELVLPPASAIEMCRRVRSDPRTVHVPILVVTSWSRPSDLEAASDAGADAVLVKPVTISAFTDAVRGLLGR